MTKIHFHIHYHTPDDVHVAVEIAKSQDGRITDILPLHTYGDGHWMGNFEIGDHDKLMYRYQLRDGDYIHTEGGGYREIDVIMGGHVFLEDLWKAPNDHAKIFASSAFAKAIFKPERKIYNKEIPKNLNKNNISFNLFAPDILPGYHIGITGSIEALGSWKKAILMSNEKFPHWQYAFVVKDQMIDFEFKYVLCDPETGDIISWEEGGNRKVRFNLPGKEDNKLVISHQGFRHRNFRWKGSGLAIPVFSIRSKNGFGIGEFHDLKGMIDFASNCKMNVVQILPVNDTIAAKTYKDSYPYSMFSLATA